MNSARARRLHGAVDTSAIHLRLDVLGKHNDLRERHPIGRIEIDRRGISKKIPSDSCLPGVNLDRSELNCVEQRQKVSTHDAIAEASSSDYPPRPHPLGHIL